MSERGSALVVTLIVLFALTAGAAAVQELSTSNVRSVARASLSQRSEAAAEGIAEVAADQIAQGPVTATSYPSFVANFGGIAAAVDASYDVSSELWTVRGTAGGKVVTETWRRDAGGTLRRVSWGASSISYVDGVLDGPHETSGP